MVAVHARLRPDRRPQPDRHSAAGPHRRADGTRGAPRRWQPMSSRGGRVLVGSGDARRAPALAADPSAGARLVCLPPRRSIACTRSRTRSPICTSSPPTARRRLPRCGPRGVSHDRADALESRCRRKLRTHALGLGLADASGFARVAGSPAARVPASPFDARAVLRGNCRTDDRRGPWATSRSRICRSSTSRRC